MIHDDSHRPSSLDDQERRDGNLFAPLRESPLLPHYQRTNIKLSVYENGIRLHPVEQTALRNLFGWCEAVP